MLRNKRSKEADFADILSALNQTAAEEASADRRSDARAEGSTGEEEQEASAPRPVRAPHLAARFGRFVASFSWRRTGSAASSAEAYAAEAAEFIEAATAPDSQVAEPPKPRDPQTEDEAIAEELGLRADLDDADLKQMRREFAKKNHPDRFEPAQRLWAARRMSIANMLIDQYLKKKI